MRTLSRWVKREYSELRLRPRRLAVETSLCQHFGRTLTLTRSGARGRDSVYLLLDRGQPFAALRLVNPFLHRKALPSSMPFRSLPHPQSIEREWECYERAAAVGLTPTPLWRANDALVCEHVPGERLSDRLRAQPLQFWELMKTATAGLARLHATAVTHMDASLANILSVPPRDRICFIDFEYGPQPGLDLGQQQAYDYLRLLESSIKFLPADLAIAWAGWVEQLEGCVDARAREADIAPLAPALARVLSHEALVDALARVFPALHTAVRL